MTELFAHSLLSFNEPPPPLDRPLLRRQAMILPLPGDELKIRPIRTVQRNASGSDALLVKLAVGDEATVIILSEEQVRLSVSRRQPALNYTEVPEKARATVLEYIFDDVMTALETVLGAPIVITAIELRSPGKTVENFAFEVEFMGLHFSIGGSFSRSQLYRLWNWATSQPREPLPDLKMEIALRCGTACLSAAQLRNFRVGDGIVLSAATDLQWHAVTGERFVARLSVVDGGFALTTPLLTEPFGPMRQLMDDPRDELTADAPAQPGSIDDIPIKLVFNAGRVTMPLSELETVEVGHVFHLDQSARTAVEIVAQGTLIGRGELISIEGLTAVRVTAINSR